MVKIYSGQIQDGGQRLNYKWLHYYTSAVAGLILQKYVVIYAEKNWQDRQPQVANHTVAQN